MIKNKSGFSLIELLVATSIIITAMTIVLGIIISSFRISSKSATQDVLRQNGNYALSQMSRTIQFTDGFVGVSSEADATNFVSCIDPPGQISNINVSYNKLPHVFSCKDNTAPNNGIFDNGNPMIDSSKIKVEAGSCNITCLQLNDSAAPVIGISFRLIYGGSSSTFEKNSTQQFSTRIKVRNF